MAPRSMTNEDLETPIQELYDEPLDADGDLERFDRREVWSQTRVVVAAVDLDCMGQEELPISTLDWRSWASRRAVASTLSAETAARLAGRGMAHYMQALQREALRGWSDAPAA
eukprot:5591772-Pyramimonas_sp.AAC.1